MSSRHDSQRRTTLFGEGSLDELGRELEALGVERAVLISGRRASRSDAAASVREQLAKRLVGEFAAVQAHVPLGDVTAAYQIARDVDADCLVAVGGGSASDAAKAVSLLLSDVEVAGLAGMHAEVGSPVTIVAVPTTLSGAETTRGGMFSHGGRKHGFGAYGLGARLIIHDPRQVADVPVEILTATGMNALAHCLEGLVCRAANPITDALALEGAETLAVGLVRLSRGESSSEVFASLQVGAALGGICLDTSSVGVHHALCHALGSAYGIVHGDSNSVVLPFALAYNEGVSGAAQQRAAYRLGPVLAALGVSEAGDLRSQVADLQHAIGVPRSLSELGVDRAGLSAVALEAYEELLAYDQNPRIPGSPEELLVILYQAFDEEERA